MSKHGGINDTSSTPETFENAIMQKGSGDGQRESKKRETVTTRVLAYKSHGKGGVC